MEQVSAPFAAIFQRHEPSGHWEIPASDARKARMLAGSGTSP
jgi:hypothetical protein